MDLLPLTWLVVSLGAACTTGPLIPPLDPPGTGDSDGSRTQQDDEAPGWWNEGNDACPPGATLKGAAPPKGDSVRCERADGTSHGRYLQWYEKGKRREQCEYADGRLHGVWFSWYENGSLAAKGRWQDDLLDGMWTWWHPNGRKAAEGEWRDGRQYGVWTWWHANGRKQRQGQFRRGSEAEAGAFTWQYLSHGTWTYWDARGDIERIERHEHGTIVSVTEYKRGKQVAHSRARKPAGKQPVPPLVPKGGVTIRGNLNAMTLEVGDKPVTLPTARLDLDLDPSAFYSVKGGVPNLKPVPEEGYVDAKPTFRGELAGSANGAAEIERWQLVIKERLDKGEGAVLRTITGSGAAPTTPWDGRDDGGNTLPWGRVYLAQLEIVTKDGTETASAVTGFGIGYGTVVAEVWEEVLRGKLFAGSAKRPRATGTLKRKVKTLAKKIQPGDHVRVEAHWDGTRKGFKTLTRTSRQARAVAALIAKTGISKDVIKARGRGSLEPEIPAKNRAAKLRNKRVVIKVKPEARPAPDTEVPKPEQREATLIVNGKAIEVDEIGRFETAVRIPADRTLAIVFEAADGRRAAVKVTVPD